jgi:hypothetical protein
MKFKNYIETESGIKDTSTSPGTAGQVLSSTVAGTSWIDQSTLVSGSAERVSILVKNGEGTALVKGDPVYIIGSVGASARLEVGLCDASNPSKMPCVGLLEQDLLNNGQGTAVTAGKLRNLPTTPIDGQPTTENDTIYVKAGGSSGLALTTTKPTGSTNLIQNVGQVGRVSSSSDGNLVVSAIMRTNDVPNLPTGRIWVGDGNTIVSDVVYLDETNVRMGIGTTSPNDDLEIKSTTIPGIRLNSTDTSFPTFGLISAVNNTTYRGGLSWANNPAQAGARLTYIGFPLGSQTTGTFEVGADFVDTAISNGAMVTRLTTTGLGIGTTSPGSLLHVSGGDIRLDFNERLQWDNGNTRIQGNSDTRMYLRAPLGYYFETNGGYRVAIDGSSGNVGIGTTSPQEKLHVQNYTTGESHQAMFKGGAVTVGDYSYISLNNGYGVEYNKEVRLAAVSEQSNSNKTGFAILTSPDSNGASGHERLRVTADGDVGIGTTSPGAKLEVEQLNSGTNTVFLSNSYNNKGFRTGNAGYATFSGYQDGNNTGSGSAYGALIGLNTFYNGTSFYNDNQYVDPSSILFKDGNILFHTNDISATGNFTPSERLRITKTGNVGIGTTSPSPIGTNITTLDIQGSSGGGFRFGTTAGVEGGLWSLGSGTTLGSISSIPLYFRTANQNRAVISSSGNFGIGTTSPNAKLNVVGGDVDFDSDNFVIHNSTGSYGGRLIAHFRQGADIIQFGDVEGYISGNTFDINYGSSICSFNKMNVGIDNASPSYLLDVNGDGRVDGTFRCVTLVQTSQADRKENIYDIDKVKPRAIPFKEFTYKSEIDDSGRKRYGVLAEDIENDYPELVYTDAEGVKGVNYIDLLVKRVAELEKELEDISLTPGPKGATGPQGPAGVNGRNGSDGRNGADGNDHLKNVQSIAFNEKYGQLEITIEGYKDPFRFNLAK